jgi:predicted metal-dependent hydrolase
LHSGVDARNWSVNDNSKSARANIAREDVFMRETISLPLSRALLKIDGRAVEVTMRLNPRARRLIVKVHPSTGEITVVAPSKRAMSHALDFARGESDWIAKKLARVPQPVHFEIGSKIPFRGSEYRIVAGERGPGPVWIDEAEEPMIRVSGRPEHVGRRVRDFLKSEARKRLAERTAHFAGKVGKKSTRLSIRDTVSRWGSCSVKGTLSYSWRLILAPDAVLDYVVAHEVAHLVEMNHGQRFWRLVAQLMPNYEPLQGWLTRNATQLHRYNLR